MILWSALLLGLGGSLHCVGMCGPIAMALPLTAREKSVIIFQSFLYNVGRICTYTLMGIFFGLMGWGIALTGYQNLLSIGLGVLLLFTSFFSISVERKIFHHPVFIRLLEKVKTKLAKLLSIRNKSSAFSIGLLNGLLPCGLVYIALAGAVATGDYRMGGLYMMAFGVGTLPLMLGVMVFGKFSKKFFVGFQKLIPYGLFLFGVFLIYRGMMLDIPAELSFWEEGNFPIMCH